MKDVLKALLFGSVFAVPFLTLYVANEMFFPYITGKNFWFRILVEIAFASWIVLALADKAYRPRFSWVLGSFTALLGVMFVANLLGEHPLSSFWSNFERMDGYVTLVHVFMYFVVLGSILTTKRLWSYFLHTTIGVAFIVALYGMAQYGGVVENKVRIDSTLGNAAYMAIYMLFHTFLVLWLFVESRIPLHRLIYGLLTTLFIFALIQTGTRGTAIGLIVGLTVMAAYIGLFGARFKEFRTAAVALFAVMILSGGIFYSVRDSAFVQDNLVLARIANISIADLDVRFTIWNMAKEGVQDRPLLGWGQSNFNYVFNQEYNPKIYNQEQWFDRVHNIFFDWLIAGGVLGFVAYFGILLASLYYLFWRPLFHADESFDVLERGVIIGLLAGYFTHNLVVFDNIISYIFYAVILAFIHARVAKEIPFFQRVRIDDRLVTQFALPIVVVVAGVTVYFVNVPGMLAAHDIINAFRASDPLERLTQFDEALRRQSFADQEIVEQLAQQAMNLAQNQQISSEVRQAFLQRAELEIMRMIEEKPGDARLHVFFASYYRATGQPVRAREEMAIARTLSPKKPGIIVQQGIIEFTAGDRGAAQAFFKEAFELEPRNSEAREFYAATLFYAGDVEEGSRLIREGDLERHAGNNFLLNAANEAGATELLVELYEARTKTEAANAQNWASLAFLYYEQGDIAAATTTLAKAAALLPEFKPRAECISENITAGRDPNAECTVTEE